MRFIISLIVLLLFTFIVFLSRAVAQDNGFSFGFEQTKKSTVDPVKQEKKGEIAGEPTPPQPTKPEDIEKELNTVIDKVKKTSSFDPGQLKALDNLKTKKGKESKPSKEEIGSKENHKETTKIEHKNDNLLREQIEAAKKLELKTGKEDKLPTISLIISAVPEDRFFSSLENLRKVVKNQKVKLNFIATVGLDEKLELAEFRAEESTKNEEDLKKELGKERPENLALKDLGVELSTYLELEELKNNFKIESSPSWIVTAQDKIYVYEGIPGPSQLFTAQGEFRDLNQQFQQTSSSSATENSGVIKRQSLRGDSFVKLPEVPVIEEEKNFPYEKVIERYKKDVSPEELVEMRNAYKANQNIKSEALNYPNPENKLMAAIYTLPEETIDEKSKLTSCESGSVRRKEIFHNTAGSENIDVLYYDPTSKRDLQNLEYYKRGAIAYDPLTKPRSEDVIDLKSMGFWGVFARKIGIQCLPSRAHYIIDGEKRFLEIIEGEDAWK